MDTHPSRSRGGIGTANGIFDDYTVAGFPEFNNDETQIRNVADLGHGRWDMSDTPGVLYPALAVPLGPADELVCPTRHIEAARQSLDRMDGLNLLVIAIAAWIRRCFISSRKADRPSVGCLW
jgi:hypothetical protein